MKGNGHGCQADLLEGLRKTKEVLRQNSKSAGQVSNPRLNEGEAGV